MSCSRIFAGVLIVMFAGTVGEAHGQTVEVGGRAYLDYFYNFASPAEQSEDLHGFQFRRLYLTTDYTLSDEFSGRARLEADEGTGGVPLVKDLSFTWAYSGEHSATAGITPPPAFGISEDFWGNRSIARTIMDFQDVVDSRDFGLRLDGPITPDGTVRYSAMVANNGTVQPESNNNKRLYAQVEVRPSDQFILVGGADYAGYDDERENATRVSTFGGYSTGPLRVGVEAYWSRVAITEGSARRDMGASFFGIAEVAPKWELIARVDRSRELIAGPDRYDTVFIGGVSYRPHTNVQLVPNLQLWDRSDQRVETTGRLTLNVQF